MTEAPAPDDVYDCGRLMERLLDVLNEVAAADVVVKVRAHAAACDACGRLWAIAHETSCRELAEFLDDYVDGSLPTEKREVFERHMSVCPECVAYVDSYRRTIDLAREAEADAPEELPPALVAAILDARRADTGTPDASPENETA